MFRKHVIRHLSAYHHGELSAGEKLNVEAHLRECSKCRAAQDEIQLGARLASALSPSSAPESIWREIHEARPASRRRRWIPQVALAGLAVAIALFVIFSRSNVPEGPSWEVAGLSGTVRLRPGEVLQTDSSSEAQVKIANIGQLTIDPNTRIRLLVTQSDQHRIALDRGKLEATTWAPPRLFIVETPSATAVDLGCKYTLEVEEDGSSLLHVTLGLVALERDARETIVPAGAFCRTRSGAGPGTPFFEDSSSQFQSALDYVDSGKDGPERTRQLEIVLRESRVRDGLTLWHLLPRLDPQSRGLIYDRLAKLLPPPPEVTRDGIMALDPKMLDAWKTVVSQLWQ
jgi:ferric-dicitrate binding protein FerR (iron transport regulator)